MVNHVDTVFTISPSKFRDKNVLLCKVDKTNPSGNLKDHRLAALHVGAAYGERWNDLRNKIVSGSTERLDRANRE